MLNEILEFFKREKIYAVLLGLLCLIYGTLLIVRPKEKEPEEKAKILTQFKKAEDKVQAKIKSSGSIEAYLKDRPDLIIWVNLFSILFIAAISAGIVIDYMLLARPEFRERFHLSRPPPQIKWKVSFLFKFFIWFFAANICVSLILGGVHRFFDWNENFFILLHTTFAEIISFAVILWILFKNRGRLADIGVSLPEGKGFREIFVGWGGYLAVLPLFGLVLLILLGITELFHYEPPPHPLVPIFLEEEANSQGIIIYSLVLAALVGPVFEEIFFRGFCYPIFKERFGTLSSMLITSSFFAFIHDSTFAFWPIFVLGMALNYVYEKRGSLAANITLHITHNLFFLGYFFLAKNIIGREIGI